MKKLFLGIATVAMAGIMCIGFAACGGESGAKSIKGEEVTENQWVAALNILLDDKEKFTVNYSYTQSIDYTHKTMVHKTEWSAKTTEIATLTKNGALESSIGTQEISLSGDKIAAEQIIGKAKKTDIEDYSEKISDKIYKYEKGKDDKWKREVTNVSVVYDEFGFMISDIKNEYNAFVYSVEHKGYISKYYEEDDDLIIVYKFNGGKLAAIYTYAETVDLTDSAQEYELTLSKSEINITIDYTAKDIILPVIETNS